MRSWRSDYLRYLYLIRSDQKAWLEREAWDSNRLSIDHTYAWGTLLKSLLFTLLFTGFHVHGPFGWVLRVLFECRHWRFSGLQRAAGSQHWHLPLLAMILYMKLIEIYWNYMKMSSTIFEKALPTCLRVSFKDCNSLPLNFTVSESGSSRWRSPARLPRAQLDNERCIQKAGDKQGHEAGQWGTANH